MPWEDEGQSKWSELLHGTYGAHEADQGYTLSRAQGSGRALAKDLNVLDGRSQSVGGGGGRESGQNWRSRSRGQQYRSIWHGPNTETRRDDRLPLKCFFLGRVRRAHAARWLLPGPKAIQTLQRQHSRFSTRTRSGGGPPGLPDHDPVQRSASPANHLPCWPPPSAPPSLPSHVALDERCSGICGPSRRDA